MTRLIPALVLVLCAGSAMANDELERAMDICRKHTTGGGFSNEWSTPCNLIDYRWRHQNPAPQLSSEQEARDLDFVRGVAGMKEKEK